MKKSRKSAHSRTTYSDLTSNEILKSYKNTGASSNKLDNITLKKRSQVDESHELQVKSKPKSMSNPSQVLTMEHNSIEELEDELNDTASVPTVPTTSKKCKSNWLYDLARKRTFPEGLSQFKSPVVPTKVVKESIVSSLETPNHDEDESQVEHDSLEGNLKEAVIREENYQIPNKSLRESFEYLGHKHEIKQGMSITRNSKSIQAKCLICLKVYSYQSPSTGGVSNLIRHLKKYHPEKGKEIEEKEALTHEKTFLHSWFNSKEKLKYQSSDMQQTRFNKALLYCIAKDKLPMSLGNGKGFTNLMSSIDPKISIPSRSTIQRRFKQEHENVVLPRLKLILSSVGKGIVSLDSWKSRRKDGILAFKFHCIDNSWNIRNLTLGIREINESQTGDTIRKYFEELTKELNIQNKVSLVMTDSGANMLKAFKAPKPKTVIEEHIDSDSDEEIQIQDLPADEIILYCESDSDDEDIVNEIDEENEVNVSPLLQNSLEHLRCTSHQLQLGINNALETEEAALFLSYMNKIINFFSNNTVFLAKLRKLAGKGLLKRAQTRWNYWIDAINRLTEDKVYLAVEKLLKEAHQTYDKKKVDGLPRKLQNSDKKKMKEFCTILRPFADLTDLLQGDGVTSSLLINSLVCKLREVQLSEAKYFMDMKKEIVAQVTTRFEGIVKTSFFILATALDARMKLNVFKLKDTGDLQLPSYSDAKALCESMFDLEIRASENQNPSKQVVPIKSFIDEINQQAEVDDVLTSERMESELDIYLREPLIPSNSNILLYWKEKEMVYPKLATAAKFYLAIPASSGSVERLFSELTAIGRAKRACTKAPAFEQLVLYAQHVDQQLQ